MEREQLAPWVDGAEVFIRHAGMFEGAREIEPEVVRGALDAIGRDVAGIDGEDAGENFLLTVFWDHLVEDGKDVGLLAEVFEV